MLFLFIAILNKIVPLMKLCDETLAVRQGTIGIINNFPALRMNDNRALHYEERRAGTITSKKSSI